MAKIIVITSCCAANQAAYFEANYFTVTNSKSKYLRPITKKKKAKQSHLQLTMVFI